MRSDSLLNFIPIGSAFSCVGATGANFPSTNTIDILGLGVGVAPTNDIIGNASLFGADTGIGEDRPLVNIVVGTAFTTSDSSTLNVQFQGAPDSATTHLPGTWQTFSETGQITAAQLTAGQVIRMDWPAAFPANESPRYLRLNFVTPSGEQFTAGTISSAIVTYARDDQANRYATKNFSLA